MEFRFHPPLQHHTCQADVYSGRLVYRPLVLGTVRRPIGLRMLRWCKRATLWLLPSWPDEAFGRMRAQ